MTPLPDTIDRSVTIAAALRLMFERTIRHLPIVDAGKIIGIVSQRELELISAFEDVSVETSSVEMAMNPHPVSVPLSEPIQRVAAKMASMKVGSVVVTQEGQPVGIFTTIDALKALEMLADRIEPETL